MAVRLFLGLVAKDSDLDAVATRFKASDATLKMLDNRQLLRVLAGATIAKCATSDDELSNLAVLAVRSGICCNQRISAPLPEVLEEVHEVCQQRSVSVRKRPLAPERPKYRFGEPDELKLSAHTPKEIGTPQNEANVLNANFKSIQSSLAELQEAVKALHRSTGRLKQDSKRAVDAAVNYTVDPRVAVLQEECDILWWLFAESLAFNGKALGDYSSTAAGLMIGAELAERTRLTLPVPAADAFLMRALKNTADAELRLVPLVDIVEESPVEWRVKWCEKTERHLDQLGSLTPVGQALCLSLDAATRGSWTGVYEKVAGLSAETELTPAQWARQAYDEELLFAALRTAEGAS